LTNFWLRSDYGLILYEYMDNGSLHDVLHEIEPAPVLEWKLIFMMIVGQL
ncbi:Receptor-like protein kinase, partial [Ananas comosus]